MNVSSKREIRAAATVGDPRWAKVVARDGAADGTFVYSVKTTGVYCRPSCASRLACPDHVSFHATPAAAERAGFRPCRRCKPNQISAAAQRVALVTNLCRMIEQSEHTPTLSELASQAGLSAFHLHRVFKQATGVTPKAYAAAHRAKHVPGLLAKTRTITDAIYAAGYSSSGRFYEQSNQVLGMTPTEFRSGGANAFIRFSVGACSFGSILIAASERGLCAILMGDDPEQLVRDLEERFPRATLMGGDSEFEKLVVKVVGFVEAPKLGLDLPLDVRGTAFQHRVWQALQAIPSGVTMSYSELAKRIGEPKAVRAVAHACAANALAVAIPCHRVVRNDGSIAGYRWGVERKRALLEREAKG